jgi:hypothetical protein
MHTHIQCGIVTQCLNFLESDYDRKYHAHAMYVFSYSCLCGCMYLGIGACMSDECVYAHALVVSYACHEIRAAYHTHGIHMHGVVIQNVRNCWICAHATPRIPFISNLQQTGIIRLKMCSIIMLWYIMCSIIMYHLHISRLKMCSIIMLWYIMCSIIMLWYIMCSIIIHHLHSCYLTPRVHQVKTPALRVCMIHIIVYLKSCSFVHVLISHERVHERMWVRASSLNSIASLLV